MRNNFPHNKSGKRGIEPLPPASETSVLPLHHFPITNKYIFYTPEESEIFSAILRLRWDDANIVRIAIINETIGIIGVYKTTYELLNKSS